MNRIDPWFSRHAYMLEFRNTNDFGWNKETQVFTFSLPPETEQFSKTQRLNYTKTFGGAVIDDYGNDLIKITLSGTTGNSDLKTIFRGNNRPASSLSGEDELLFLDKLIEDYGKYDRLENKKIFLYDLSKLNFKSVISTPPYWEVKIDSFKYQRDKSRPTFYKYTLELTGYKPSRKFELFNLSEKIELCLNTLNTIATVIIDTFGTTTLILDSAYLLKDEIDNFFIEYKKYESLVSGIISDVSEDIKDEYIKLGDWFQGEKKITTNITDWKKSEMNNYDSKSQLKNAADTILETSADISKKTTDIVENMPEGQLETISKNNDIETRDEFESITLAMLDELKSNAEFLVAAMKQIQQVAYYKGTIYYGKKLYTVNSTSTYESISLELYNTVEYADIIRVFNDSIELKTGIKIVTPILSEKNSIVGNEVIKSINDIDDYGKDIRIDDNGELKVDYSNGDLLIVDKEKNLEQAITARLSTEMGTRIRDIVYGIQSSIGETNAITAFLYSSIYQTLLEDPRIREIESIQFEGQADALYFQITYISKIGEKITMGGQI